MELTTEELKNYISTLDNDLLKFVEICAEVERLKRELDIK